MAPLWIHRAFRRALVCRERFQYTRAQRTKLGIALIELWQVVKT